MTYYHASPTGGLQILEPRKSPFFDKPTQVCLTSLRAMALFYLIRNYEYAYGYTRQGKLYFDDPFPDALKKLYAGRSGWLYICEDGDYEEDRNSERVRFRAARPHYWRGVYPGRL
ncbi:MAG: hypothetical protein ACLU3I_19010 [Acutalibacteraceae bacterium]